MSYYLVRARPRRERLDELLSRLQEGEFVAMRPFGKALAHALSNARREEGGDVVWEEDYCSPPLAQERAALLDRFFEEIRTERVPAGEGWESIVHLAPLFPALEYPSKTT